MADATDSVSFAGVLLAMYVHIPGGLEAAAWYRKIMRALTTAGIQRPSCSFPRDDIPPEQQFLYQRPPVGQLWSM